MESHLISIWLGTLALFLLAIWFQRRPKKTKISSNSNEIYPMNLRIYYFLLRFSYTRSLLRRYESSLKQLTRLREEKLFHQTGNFFRKMILVFFLFLSGLLFVTGNILYLGMYVLVIVILLEVFLDYILVKRHNKLLQGQILFNELVRQKYYEQGTVEEALYEACQDFPDKDNPMLIQGEYLYDVLMESNVEEAVQIYNRHAPNKYLKMLLNLCYITSEYGDSQENGQSVFMNSLSYLTNEIRVEEMKRNRLNYSLKSLHFIAMLPLLCMLPLQNWAARNFQPLQLFYSSRYGKIAEIGMFCLILFSVLILRKIQNIGIITGTVKRRKAQEERLLNQRRLRILAFIVGVGLILFIDRQEYQRIKHTSVLEASMIYNVGKEESLDVLRQKEWQWLVEAKGKKDEQSAKLYLAHKVELQPELAHLQGRGRDLYIDKLYQKLQFLKKPIIEVWHVAAAALVAYLIGFWFVISDVLIGRVRELEREDEVAGYRSILLMLMYHTRLGMEDILSWLNMFSDYYEESFDRCLNNFSMGVEEAFLELKKEKQPDFQTLVLQLEAASRDLSLRQAFDDLVHEKAYYLERRKEINQRMITKRLAMGDIIGFLPAYGLIVLYLIIPMIYSGMESLSQFYQQI